MSNLKEEILTIAKDAKKASELMEHISSAVKDKALLAMADGLEKRKADIFKANKKDILLCKAKKLKAAFIDRLTLND